MGLKQDWKRIVKKAWSIRLMMLAGFFSGLEVAIPYVDQIVTVHRGLFAAVAFVATAGAFVTRLMVQNDMDSK